MTGYIKLYVPTVGPAQRRGGLSLPIVIIIVITIVIQIILICKTNISINTYIYIYNREREREKDISRRPRAAARRTGLASPSRTTWTCRSASERARG